MVKQHKPWLDEDCLRFLEQIKQAKIQLGQEPNQSSVENLSNARLEVSRIFNKKQRNIRKLNSMNLKLTVR
jgi:hypothetical protein